MSMSMAACALSVLLPLPLLLLPHPVFAFVPFVERIAIVDLFTATRGDTAWLRTDGWLDADPCNNSLPWFGVQCNAGNTTIVYAESPTRECSSVLSVDRNERFLGRSFLRARTPAFAFAGVLHAFLGSRID